MEYIVKLVYLYNIKAKTETEAIEKANKKGHSQADDVYWATTTAHDISGHINGEGDKEDNE